MRIRTKSTVFLLVILAIFILGLGFYLKFKESELSTLFKQESLDLEQNFDKILGLKSKSLYAFAYDYTYWEEMYLFAEAKDGVMKGADGQEYDMYVYGETYITSEGGLDTFKANAAWVYNLDLSVIYWTSNLGDESIKEIPIPIKGAIDKLFPEKENFCKFFVFVPKGLMEIHGAKIKRGGDEDRLGPHAGYFFVGRLWGSDTVSELAELTATDLSITREQKKEKSNPGKGIIILSRILSDWSGKPLAYLNAEKVSKVITSYQKTAKESLYYLIIFSALVLLVLAVFLSRFVTVPMGLISKALKEEDSASTRILLKDKSEFSEISRLIGMFLEQRNVLISEIKDREEAEKQLRESKKFIENVIETAKSVIIVLDKESKIKSVNRYAEKFLGIDRDQMIGKTWGEVFSSPGKRDEVKRLFEESLKGHRLVGHEVSLTTKGGEEKTVLWYDSELIDDKGNTIGIVMLGYDATQIKRAHEVQRLVQLGKLVSDMAHEVNNPLMVISGRAQLLLMEGEWNENTKEGLDIIFGQCGRAREIIERLLKFAKESNKKFEDVDLNESLDFVVKILEHQLSLQDINIVREYDAGPVTARIDNTQMQEVFMNILKNSAEAMPEGGTITVSTSKSDTWSIVEIKDTGEGIAAEVLARIFDPFFTTKEMGTGLGLSVSYGIVKLHGGDLKYASTPGKGVTATIFLPLLK
ncbi:MAG: ATP-binding protein [Candidatus Omnitrophota bacterium]